MIATVLFWIFVILVAVVSIVAYRDGKRRERLAASRGHAFDPWDTGDGR